MYSLILIVLLMVLLMNARHARMESARVSRPPTPQQHDGVHAPL
jgi:hypothetical protein